MIVYSALKSKLEQICDVLTETFQCACECEDVQNNNNNNNKKKTKTRHDKFKIGSGPQNPF